MSWWLLDAVDTSGDPVPADPDRQISELLGRLKKLMADPEKGAWISVSVALSGDGEYGFTFNDDRQVYSDLDARRSIHRKTANWSPRRRKSVTPAEKSWLGVRPLPAAAGVPAGIGAAGRVGGLRPSCGCPIRTGPVGSIRTTRPARRRRRPRLRFARWWRSWCGSSWWAVSPRPTWGDEVTAGDDLPSHRQTWTFDSEVLLEDLLGRLLTAPDRPWCAAEGPGWSGWRRCGGSARRVDLDATAVRAGDRAARAG